MSAHPDLDRHIGKFYGKYSGVVTAVEDDDHLGRITVKVPAVLGTEVAVLARPCLPFGHSFVPPVGAKVWVEFEAGNPSFPLWVGCWYPTGTTPTEAAVQPPENRVIQTPSGHTIEMLDTAGEEKITIRHKGNAFLSIDKNGSVLISNSKGSHIYLNAEDEEATFVEQHGHLIAMTADAVMITNKDGSFVELKGGKARVVAADGLQVTAKSITLDGGSISLGANATEPVILGNAFALAWGMHTHPTALGPSGPPIPSLAALAATVMSKKVKVK